jgi:hypothetical protein
LGRGAEDTFGAKKPRPAESAGGGQWRSPGQGAAWQTGACGALWPQHCSGRVGRGSVINGFPWSRAALPGSRSSEFSLVDPEARRGPLEQGGFVDRQGSDLGVLLVVGLCMKNWH